MRTWHIFTYLLIGVAEGYVLCVFGSMFGSLKINSHRPKSILDGYIDVRQSTYIIDFSPIINYVEKLEIVASSANIITELYFTSLL